MNAEDLKKMEMFDAAERKASQYAPPAIFGPTMGGCLSAFFAASVIVVYSIAGLEVDGVPLLVTMVIFFIASMAFLTYQEKRHRIATMKELEILKRNEPG